MNPVPAIVCETCLTSGPKGTQQEAGAVDIEIATAMAHELWNKRAPEVFYDPAVTKTERCETCRFWSMHAHNTKTGWCKRFPPVPVVVPAGSSLAVEWEPESYHPETTDIEWCGEWKAKA